MKRTPVYAHLLRAKAELIEAGLAGNLAVQEAVEGALRSIDEMLSKMDSQASNAEPESEQDDGGAEVFISR